MYDSDEERFFAKEENEIHESEQKHEKEKEKIKETERALEIDEKEKGEGCCNKEEEDEKAEEEEEEEEVDPLDAFMCEINKVLEEQKKAEAQKAEAKKAENSTYNNQQNESEVKSDNESSLDDNDVTADTYEFIEKKRAEMEMKRIHNEDEDIEEEDENEEGGTYECNYLDGIFEEEKNVNDEEIMESIDYSTIEVDPFEKNIFVMGKNTADFTLEQSVEYKKKNNIVATGFNIPKPIFSFLQIKNLIDEPILQSWYEQPFHRLSPIQSMIVPVFLSGRDFIATSRTGSGKTLSFIISLTIHLLHLKKKLAQNEFIEYRNTVDKEKEVNKSQDPVYMNSQETQQGGEEKEETNSEVRPGSDETTYGMKSKLYIPEKKQKNYAPHAVILTPTKELCVQIYEEMNRISLNQIKSCILFRGLNYHKACAQIKKGVDVIICNSKILIHFVNKKIIPLQNIKYFILDEFDKLFEKQNFGHVVSILQNSRPDSIKGLYTSIVTDFMIERVKPFLNKKFIIIKIEDKNSLIMQNFVVTLENDKYNHVVKYLTQVKHKGLDKNQGIIFCNSKKNIIYVYEKLKKEASLHPIVFDYIHGDVDHRERITKFKNFQKKKIHILISSDLMSRGIDVVDVNFVINYDCPNYIFSYVHRIGRCSRANNRGDAVTFITQSDKTKIYHIYKYLKEKNELIPSELEDFIKSCGNMDYQNEHGKNNGKMGKKHKRSQASFSNDPFLTPAPKVLISLNEKELTRNPVSFKKSTSTGNNDSILKNLNVVNPDDVLTSSDD